MIVKASKPSNRATLAYYLMQFNVWIWNLKDKDNIYIDTFGYREAEKLFLYYPDLDLFSYYHTIKVNNSYPELYKFYKDDPEQPIFFFEILKKRKIKSGKFRKTIEDMKPFVPQHKWYLIETETE